MIFEDYIAAALRTAKLMTTIEGDFKHGVIGLITEIGEFASEVKRIAIYEKLQTAEMTAHMLEELGDAYWYVPVTMRGLGITRLASFSETEIGWPVQQAQTLEMIVYALSSFTGALSARAVDPQFSVDDEAAHSLLNAIVLLLDRASCLLGSSGDEVRAANIAKLRKRYPDAYSNEAAEARADKGGVSHTES